LPEGVGTVRQPLVKRADPTSVRQDLRPCEVEATAREILLVALLLGAPLARPSLGV
jgi:hypothetical protein